MSAGGIAATPAATHYRLEHAASKRQSDLSVAIELPGGMTFDMTGEQYSRDWALPQFYFHVVTAYAILRNQGVEIGKAEYVPHMFAYLRPGTMAAA